MISFLLGALLGSIIGFDNILFLIILLIVMCGIQGVLEKIFDE